MTEILFNTMDVARMLQIDKSTVKRWTDEGKLKCFRTPGGHRKFKAEDLYQFMSEYSYGVTPTEIQPQYASDEAVLQRIITKKEYNVLASVCFSESIKGKKAEVLRLFSESYRYGLTLPTLFDEVLRPTIRRIGEMFRSGKINAGEYQLAMNALSTSLVLLSDVTAKPASNGKKVVCATVEGDGSDHELKAAAILLESEGFEVLNLGAGVATDIILQLIHAHQPEFICLLNCQPVGEQVLVNEHTKIMNELKSYGGKLVILGNGYSRELLASGLSTLHDRYCATFKELAQVEDKIIAQNFTAMNNKN